MRRRNRRTARRAGSGSGIRAGGGAVLVVVLAALSTAGLAQSPAWIEAQGFLTHVDCRSRTFVIASPAGTQVFTVDSGATVSINSAAVSFCALAKYVGTCTRVSVAILGNERRAKEVEVAAPAPGPCNGVGIGPPPKWWFRPWW
jgi:hypothetical protein